MSYQVNPYNTNVDKLHRSTKCSKNALICIEQNKDFVSKLYEMVVS